MILLFGSLRIAQSGRPFRNIQGLARRKEFIQRFDRPWNPADQPEAQARATLARPLGWFENRFRGRMTMHVSPYLRLGLLGLLILAGVLMLIFLPVKEHLVGFLDWIRNMGPWGPVLL